MKRHRKRNNEVERTGLWSTEYSKQNGQAIVTARVAEQVLPALGRYRRYVFPGTSRPRAVIEWTLAWFGLWQDTVLGRLDTLYLVCSRSNMGFFRDLPALVVARAGIRVVVHAHGSDIVDLLCERRLSPLARWVYSRCNMVVPSAHLTKSVENLVQSVVVCEGFFVDRNESSSKITRNSVGLQILWNSNVMASKGFFDLAAAVNRANDEGLSISLVSVGDLLEDEEQSHAELLTNIGPIKDAFWCQYRGPVEHSTALKLLADTDVVALPSRYSSECQPIAVIEAMCCGKAILVSELSALRATVRGYPAEFVEVRSVDAILRGLKRLYTEKRTNPVEFVERRSASAIDARLRFSIDRFDQDIGGIIVGANGGHLRKKIE